MSDEEKPEGHKDTTEILATALAESSANATASSNNTVRVLGVLLAFSVLGNIALAGLNIKGNFFGTDIEMGGADAQAPMMEAPMMEDFGYMEMEEDVPPAEWCAEMKTLGELGSEDEQWCRELYPDLWQ